MQIHTVTEFLAAFKPTLADLENAWLVACLLLGIAAVLYSVSKGTAWLTNRIVASLRRQYEVPDRRVLNAIVSHRRIH